MRFKFVPEWQAYHTELQDEYMGVVFRLPGSDRWLWAVTRDPNNTARWKPAKTLYGARIACARALIKQRSIVRKHEAWRQRQWRAA